MYTKEDYLAEKNAMSKQERMIQERFEQLINVLIMFKQEHKDKDVFLSEKSINESLKWFHGNVSTLMDSMQK
ncbi:MAG: hypothetical protein CMD68_02400 [Gammaproteobacteria bacterium]|nr:hypothetical protein [Gammaproteobacteria bacterium]|tara:strand:+ start:2215 stop:2430 length:216 start_codon:yes stop_codon:yes gene_type:complete